MMQENMLNVVTFAKHAKEHRRNGRQCETLGSMACLGPIFGCFLGHTGTCDWHLLSTYQAWLLLWGLTFWQMAQCQHSQSFELLQKWFTWRFEKSKLCSLLCTSMVGMLLRCGQENASEPWARGAKRCLPACSDVSEPNKWVCSWL